MTLHYSTTVLVMSNPAAHLHDLITAWAGGSSSTSEAARRGAKDAESKRKMFQVTHAALDHLREIEGILDDLDAQTGRADVYRKHLDNWYAWVLAYPDGWARSGEVTFQDETSLDMLYALAANLAVRTSNVPPETVANIRELVDEARDLLADDESLPGDLRRHLHAVLSHAHQVAEDYTVFGEFSLQLATERLLVGLNAAKHSSKAEGPKWSRMWQRASDAFAAQLGLEGANLALEAGASGLKAITSGSS